LALRIAISLMADMLIRETSLDTQVEASVIASHFPDEGS
jgi:hypothetical protein